MFVSHSWGHALQTWSVVLQEHLVPQTKQTMVLGSYRLWMAGSLVIEHLDGEVYSLAMIPKKLLSSVAFHYD